MKLSQGGCKQRRACDQCITRLCSVKKIVQCKGSMTVYVCIFVMFSIIHCEVDLILLREPEAVSCSTKAPSHSEKLRVENVTNVGQQSPKGCVSVLCNLMSLLNLAFNQNGI